MIEAPRPGPNDGPPVALGRARAAPPGRWPGLAGFGRLRGAYANGMPPPGVASMGGCPPGRGVPGK